MLLYFENNDMRKIPTAILKLSHATGSGDGGFATEEEKNEQNIVQDGFKRILRGKLFNHLINCGIPSGSVTTICDKTCEQFCKDLLKYAQTRQPIVWPLWLDSSTIRYIKSFGSNIIL